MREVSNGSRLLMVGAPCRDWRAPIEVYTKVEFPLRVRLSRFGWLRRENR